MEPAHRGEAARACERFLGRLQDALDERGGTEALGRDPHVGACPACRSALEDLATLDRVLASEPAPEPPPGFAATVVARIESDAAAARRRARLSAVGALAAAVALGVGLDLVGGTLRAGFEALVEDGQAFARAASVRAGSLGLEDVRGLELPALPSLPGTSGSLATLALAVAAVLVAGELVWWRRARRAGGVA